MTSASDGFDAQAKTGADGTEYTENKTMSKRHVQRLVRLAKDFDRTVEGLPNNKGQVYKQQQKEIADARRKAEMSEGLLRMRVR
jgi:hypothetical protein